MLPLPSFPSGPSEAAACLWEEVTTILDLPGFSTCRFFSNTLGSQDSVGPPPADFKIKNSVLPSLSAQISPQDGEGQEPVQAEGQSGLSLWRFSEPEPENSTRDPC